MKSWNLQVKKIGESWLFTISGQKQKIVIDGSYIFDPIDNLFTAIRLLLKGEQESEASFFEEPEEKIINFQRNANELIIKIYGFEEYKGIGRNKEKGKLIMQLKVEWNKFLNRLINEFHTYQEDDKIKENLKQLIELRN